MATKLTGKARVHGLNGDIAYDGVATPSDALLQSAGFGKDAAFKDELDHPSTGERIGGAYAKENIAGDIEFIPVADATGNTIANARLGLHMPDIPFKVTLSSFDHNHLNGDYMCDGGLRIQLGANGNCRITMPIIRYTAAGSDATTLTTVIS